MPRKRKTRKKPTDSRFLRPTEAREAHNDFQSAGAARRVTPAIDRKSIRAKLTDAQHLALHHYRDLAHRAEDDQAKDSALSPKKIMGGVSGGTSVGTIPTGLLLATPAIIETSRIERALTEERLFPITRAVVVEDKSLEQWCIGKYGGRERYDGQGRLVAIVPVSEHKVMRDEAKLLSKAADIILRAC